MATESRTRGRRAIGDCYPHLKSAQAKISKGDLWTFITPRIILDKSNVSDYLVGEPTPRVKYVAATALSHSSGPVVITFTPSWKSRPGVHYGVRAGNLDPANRRENLTPLIECRKGYIKSIIIDQSILCQTRPSFGLVRKRLSGVYWNI